MVVADGALGLQPLDEGQPVGIADNRHIELRESGPDGAMAIFDGIRNLRRAGIVVVLVVLVEIGVVVIHPADGHFHVTARQRKNRAVRGGAIFVDQHFLAIIAEAGDEADRGRAVAGECRRVAEQIQIRHVCRLGKARKHLPGRNRPSQGGTHLPRIDQT